MLSLAGAEDLVHRPEPAEGPVLSLSKEADLSRAMSEETKTAPQRHRPASAHLSSPAAEQPKGPTDASLSHGSPQPTTSP